ncbi:MAG: CPBP family intramembrane glutamic endopeptidase [bacterium]
MKLPWRYALIILGVHWLFIKGLYSAYHWLSRDVFYIPRVIGEIDWSAIFIWLFALAVLIVVFIIIRKPVSFMGLGKTQASDWKRLGLYLAFVWPVSFIGRLVVPEFDVWYVERFGLLVGWGILGFFMVGLVFIVFKEEILQRIMQRLLLPTYGLFFACLATAMQFGIAHYFSKPLEFGLASAISVALVSFVLAVLYAQTKNLWISLSFHLIFNLIVMVQILLHARGDLVGEWLLWIVWGLAWLILLKPAFGLLKELFGEKMPKIKIGDWTFLALFGLVLPITYLFIYG